jgi:predicted small lipoprotein YifL
MIAPSVRIRVFPIDDTMRATLSAALLGGTLFLCGCGIKGPLYLPERPAAPPKASVADAADHSKAQPAQNESK